MAKGAYEALVLKLGSFVAQAAARPMVARRSTNQLGGIDRAARPRGPDPVIRERLAFSDSHANRHDHNRHSHARWCQGDGTKARNYSRDRPPSGTGATRGSGDSK